MHLQTSLPAFNTRAAIAANTLLPVLRRQNEGAITCAHCRFVNQSVYSFCTNCGYPMQPNKDNLALYNMRLNRRKALEKRCAVKIVQGRNALYILGGIMSLGIFSLFSTDKSRVLQGIVMLVSGGVYIGLGRWSLTKPFSSLLIGLLMVITFSAINLWTSFDRDGAVFDSFYQLFIQLIFIYFLWQSMQAAFTADVLEDEFNI